MILEYLLYLLYNTRRIERWDGPACAVFQSSTLCGCPCWAGAGLPSVIVTAPAFLPPPPSCLPRPRRLLEGASAAQTQALSTSPVPASLLCSALLCLPGPALPANSSVSPVSCACSLHAIHRQLDSGCPHLHRLSESVTWLAPGPYPDPGRSEAPPTATSGSPCRVRIGPLTKHHFSQCSSSLPIPTRGPFVFPCAHRAESHSGCISCVTRCNFTPPSRTSPHPLQPLQSSNRAAPRVSSSEYLHSLSRASNL